MTAASLPLRHISLRVPWHQAGWNGTICGRPGHNTACLKLKNIADSKDERAEAEHAGKSINDLTAENYPPCVKERATFMAPFSFSRMHQHPYAESSPKTHSHFRPTALNYPAYGAAALPFRWMMKEFVFGNSEDGIAGLVDRFPLPDVSMEYEPTLPFETIWVQDHRNHRTLLDCFWNHIRVEESLVFFYAKQVPLVEDTGRRVVVGVGRVKSIGGLTEYNYDGDPTGKLRSLLWERMVVHSIRSDFSDGFLMPYHEALEKSDEGRAFDPAEVVAFAPEDRFDEFSYGTEHVSHDAAISTLLACRSALHRAAERFNVAIHKQEAWIDRELGRLWKKRGPFPGLGAVLAATGIPMGNFIAQFLADKAGDAGNPWQTWDAVLSQPDKLLPKDLSQNLDSTIAKAWKRMPEERRAFLELLSRIDLSAEQAECLAVPEARGKRGVDLPDSAFLKNPYLIYESTRLTATPVSVGTVDRGLFATPFIRERFPLSSPTLVKTAVDSRRLRALVIRELEEATGRGDTLRARDDIITSLRLSEESIGDGRTAVTADLLAVAEEEFGDAIRLVKMADTRVAYQLGRFIDVGNLIRDTVTKRVAAPRHMIAADWRTELDHYLDADRKRRDISPSTDPIEIALEDRARQEKAAALQEIASSRFSVLIGPAGTGKTTLLSVLCQRTDVSEGGILLLAPTGKARVRMESMAKQAGTTGFLAFTLAQFLSGSGRYDGATKRYQLTGEPGEKVARTVIVDECSMLTEEMMAALLEALTGVHRLIFVGDHRQLPPIGAGRPFVDIVAHLAPEDRETRFPRVAPGFAELTVPRRQGSNERDDLQLAAWFGGGATAPGDDQVFEILAGRRKSDHIKFVRWETPEELEQLLPDALAETLRFDSKQQEWQSFALSLGAKLDDRGSAWFNVAYGNRPSSGKQAEAWQILSPVRQKPWGVDTLNRLVHLRYKGQQIEQARKEGPFRSIPRPMGDAQIIYGDKVIHNRNWTVPRSRIYPKPDDRGYLANGEIGMVVGHRKTKARSWYPKDLEIEFSTQVGVTFKFYDSDFSDDGDASLDLAYALTVHKSQGSEFEVVFLVLPRSPLMLTRELLYTALTRQKQKVVVLHQGDSTELHKLTSERLSSSATRLTNLFRAPKPVKVGDSFLEEFLIHTTSRGDAVRSKSEVIIADHLHTNKVQYHYEQPLTLDGVTKYPDFTIEDDDLGITFYWEHCGMLSNPGYRSRWEEKKQWYIDHGILPHEQGGGSKGTLIVTEDRPDGGISSKDILNLVRTVIRREKT